MHKSNIEFTLLSHRSLPAGFQRTEEIPLAGKITQCFGVLKYQNVRYWKQLWRCCERSTAAHRYARQHANRNRNLRGILHRAFTEGDTSRVLEQQRGEARTANAHSWLPWQTDPVIRMNAIYLGRVFGSRKRAVSALNIRSRLAGWCGVLGSG